MDSRRIDSDSTVDMVFHLKWKGDGVAHTDGYQASRINIWRDYIPPSLLEEISGKQAGDRFELQLTSNDFIQEYAKQSLFQIKNKQFDPQSTLGAKVIPAVGRFYPRGILKSVAGVFSANVQPFRLVHVNNGNMMVDFNHPLAGKELILSGIVGKVENKATERGGSSVDWIEVLTTGPGMQARWQGQQTDFLSAEAFARDDEKPDTLFYNEPRLVQHIDDTAIEMLKNTMGGF